NLTDPSANAMLAPPGWLLLRPHMPGASMSPPQGSSWQLGYGGFGASSVLPSDLPYMPWIQVQPSRLLFFIGSPTEPWEAPAQAMRNAGKRSAPLGIELLGLFQPPSPFTS